MSHSHASHPAIPAGEALARLHAGNASFRAGGFSNAVQSGRVEELLAGQHPFAAILCCSDSRVPPEIVFSRSLGDLFVVRNAGHVLDEVSLGSLEYAVEHLGVQLIVVLGHEKCGAVTATVADAEATASVAASAAETPHQAPVNDHIPSIMSLIRPALEKVRGQAGDPVANAIDAHVVETVNRLRTEPVMAEASSRTGLQVVGWRYNLCDGTVTPIA